MAVEGVFLLSSSWDGQGTFLVEAHRIAFLVGTDQTEQVGGSERVGGTWAWSWLGD